MPDPTLGYGQQSEQGIDRVNIWMRSTPWYQQQMRNWGQDPGHPTLTKSQSQQILRMAQAQGVVVDEGQMEVDDHGNFNPVGHKLRNTLIVAGIAGATIATMGAAGVFAGTAPIASGGALASTTTVPLATGTIAGGTGLAAGAGAAGAGAAISPGLASVAAAAGTRGLSYGDILRYGLPVAGNLVGGLIEANAQGRASDAQQRYLEEALAYEKEKDQYQRGIDAAAIAREEQRYGNYQGRIAPWIANGVTSNDRMAALLGLPARANVGPGYGGGYSGPTGSPEPLPGDPKVHAFIADWKLRHAATEGIAPLAAALKAAGLGGDRFMYGQTPCNNELTIAGTKFKVLGGEGTPGAYWYEPGTNDSPYGGSSRSYAPAAVTSVGSGQMPVAAPARQPAAMVSLRAPDGSIRDVSSDQVDHFVSRGATPVSASSSGGGSVQMRAPDGTIKAVLPNQVAYYESRGAQRIGVAA